MNDRLRINGRFRMQICRPTPHGALYVRKASGEEVLCALIHHEPQWSNLIVDTGRDFIRDNSLASATLYLGLIDASPTIVAANTMASHGGWTEFTEYDETTRQLWSKVAGTTGQLTNAASLASFTADGTITSIGGALLTTSNTKSGTTGTLVAAGARAAGNLTGFAAGDIIRVEYAIVLNDDGV